MLNQETGAKLLSGRESQPARPFLKWAGGKGQLLGALSAYFPAPLLAGRSGRYFEPFLGGGAVYFRLYAQGSLRFARLNDVCPELVLTYKAVQATVGKLTAVLGDLARAYERLDAAGRERYYYQVRDDYNAGQGRLGRGRLGQTQILRAARAIFLNKTCFNGLYRQSRSGRFNVPFGRYKNPCILDEANLRAASLALGPAEIVCRDFADAVKGARQDDFIYYDPPYRPLSRSAAFTAYAKESFAAPEQERLAELFASLSKKGVLQMLSNSDPKNVCPGDDYFEQLYPGFNIFRVKARRAICCKPQGRGELFELVITNYLPATRSLT